MKLNPDRIKAIVLAGTLVATLVGLLNVKQELNDTQEILKETQMEYTALKNSYNTLELEKARVESAKIEADQLLLEERKISAGLQDSLDISQGALVNAHKEIDDLKKKRAAIATKAMPSRGSEPSGREITMTATAYTAYCNGCSGTTRTGLNLRANPEAKVIAVDPSIIPLGSKVWVEGYGYAVAADTGGAIKGYKIDIFIPTKAEAYKWGRQTVRVKIL